MDKTAIKNYAIWARVQLIESCKQRAFEYGIIEDGENRINIDTINSHVLTAEEKEQRRQLIEQINQKGYSQVMEEAAYTWFNRFIALRFMEVNGYLPSKVRVFTDEDNNFKPEILKEAMTIDLDGIDRTKVAAFLEKQDNEALYKYLLITQCNALNSGLPYMFETISNWTELLFPDNLLRNDSVVGRLISDICVDDWTDEVEIIGWLYQYYISQKHEEVIDPLHGKVIKKEDIPAATQLFTTDWVVRYIVDNSLGRYWIERHPDSKLADSLEYLVMPKNGKLPLVNESITPEEIKVLDPCVGSGHFLSYAFDVLLNIYRECGWSDRDAAKSIIEHNLYGLDIDDRAAQLACFAVAMKARKYYRRVIDQILLPNICAIQESSFISEEFIQFVSNGDDTIRNDLNELQIAFHDGKELGSIIKAPKIDIDILMNRIDFIQLSPISDLNEMEYKKLILDKLLPLIKQVSILSYQYDVVVTNPPYLNKYSPKLKNYIIKNYASYKGDLFSVFMIRNFDFCKTNGYLGFMTPMVWMFIKTYEAVRRFIIENKSITTLIQFEYSAFEEATVPICSFVLKNSTGLFKGQYFRLSGFTGGMDIQRDKVLAAINNIKCTYYYETAQDVFSTIPGSPIAYWIPSIVSESFRNHNLISDMVEASVGIQSGDNDLFLRFWWEIGNKNINRKAECIKDSFSGGRWFPYNKGGSYRKWYGNNESVINWQNDGSDIKNYCDNTGHHYQQYKDDLKFKQLVTWSRISSGKPSFRYREHGSLSDMAGFSLYSNDKQLKIIIAFCNSTVAEYYLDFLSPTINFMIGQIVSLPLIVDDCEDTIVLYSERNVLLAKNDCDSFETSWDFKRHPLI